MSIRAVQHPAHHTTAVTPEAPIPKDPPSTPDRMQRAQQPQQHKYTARFPPATATQTRVANGTVRRAVQCVGCH